jgi:menaquinol-cytochrome c reductase iron-sulfur subunit
MKEEPQSPLSDKVDNPRRRFLKSAIGILPLLSGFVLGIPFIRALVSSKAKTAKQNWSRVSEVNSLPDGKPVRLNFSTQTEDAYLYQTAVSSVWVIRNSPTEVTVYSPVCPHLGCYYNWNPQNEHFECPCHNSVFSISGKVLAGPSPRPLDTLSSRIENGILFVRWEQFKAGIPEKVPV